jgi:hypothetical protein
MLCLSSSISLGCQLEIAATHKIIHDLASLDQKFFKSKILSIHQAR